MEDNKEYISLYKVLDEPYKPFKPSTIGQAQESFKQQDDYIIQCANELVRAIRVSGRDIMNSLHGEGYGSFNIYIMNNENIEVVKYASDKPFSVIGKLI